jgi:hypothetical protein
MGNRATAFTPPLLVFEHALFATVPEKVLAISGLIGSLVVSVPADYTRCL